MRRLLFLIIMAVLILVSQAVVQSPALLEVTEFTGGLVNSIENSLMDKNQARILVNYDINKGKLDRRPGVRLQYPDAFSGQTMSALLPFYRGLHKEVLTIRKLASKYGDDRDSLYHLTICTQNNSVCTTVIFQGYLPFERESTLPFNITYDYMKHGLLIAATQSELVVFDSQFAYPLRPIGPGQPKAVAMSGGGNVTGIFRYKYGYGTGGLEPTSNLSAPSWPVTVNAGKVVLYNLLAPTDTTEATGLPLCYIYREENYDGSWEVVNSFVTLGWATNKMTFLDNRGSTVDDDTLDFPWGNTRESRPAADSPPPGIVIQRDTVTVDSFGVGLVSDTVFFPFCTVYVGYAITQIDSFGTESHISAPVWARVTNFGDSIGHPLDWQYKMTIKNIPAPTDSGIVKRWLLRSFDTTGLIIGEESPESLRIGDWYRLFSFPLTSDSIVDSLRGTGWHDSLFCLASIDSSYTQGIFGDSFQSFDKTSLAELPESLCFNGDSILSGRPSVIMQHGFRAYTIDEQFPNDLLYSEFAKFHKWAPSKRITISSKTGDWLNNFVSLGTNRFMGFRQNSIVQISGHSFFQFTIDDVIRGLGSVAPRSVIYSRNRGGFASYDGYYLFDGAGNVGDPAASMSISNSIDSADTNIIRAFAAPVGSEIWLSLPIGGTRNSHTYILDLEPPQHWKSYDFGVIDMIQMEVDTTLQDFRAGRYLMILDNDSMYNWNYKDTAFDNKGGDIIVARYESKFFFDDNKGIRERVFSVDIYGEASSAGANDSLWVYVSQNKGARVDTVLIIPDFTDNVIDRATFNVLCDNFAIGWVDNGIGDYSITGYKVEGAGWDAGRKP